MPLKVPIKKTIGLLAYSILGAGAISYPYKVAKQEVVRKARKTEEIKVLPKVEQEALRGKSPELSWFEKARLTERLKKESPKELYLRLEKHIEEKSLEIGLSKDLALFLFYNRSFDLENPLGVYNYNYAKLLYPNKYKLLLGDPFSKIDLGLEILKDIYLRSRTKEPIEILTQYLFGPFKSRAEFLQKRKLVIKSFKRYKREAKKMFEGLLQRAPGIAFLKYPSFSLKHYDMLSLESFSKMSKAQQIAEIKRFVFVLAKHLFIAPEIILKIIEVESNYDFNAENKFTKALGLMQIREIAFKELKRLSPDLEHFFGRPLDSNLINPYLNIFVGCMYFKYVYEVLNHDLNKAKIAYNIGLEAYLNDYGKDEDLQKSGKRYLDKQE